MESIGLYTPVTRRVQGRFQAWLNRVMVTEDGRFAPWLSVFMVLGTLLYFQLLTEPLVWVGAAAVAMAGGLLWLGRGSLVGRAGAACVLAVSLGFLSGQIATWRAPPIEALPSRAVVLTARVRMVEPLPTGRRLVLEHVGWDDTRLHRSVRVRLRNSDPGAPQPGDTIQLRAMLRPPFPPALPGGWDLQRDAFFNGQAGAGWALNDVTILRSARIGFWARLRQAVGDRFRTEMPAPEGAIAATLFTGDAGAIPLDDRAAFRDSGLAHLLAVAGLHIGLVMALVFGLVRRCCAMSEYVALRWPCKEIAAVCALVAGGGYFLLTGGHVPIFRSFWMAALVLAGLLLGRRARPMRALACAAVLLLALSPEAVTGVAFQMSFAAVLALIAGFEAAAPLLRWMRGDGAWYRRFAAHGLELILVSLLAGMASTPFAAFHFGRVQLYFVLANVVAVPLMAMLVMPTGLLAVLLMPLGWERVALWPMQIGITAILSVGRHVSAWPSAVVLLPGMPGVALVLLAAGLVWLCLWRGSWRFWGLLGGVAGALCFYLARPPDVLVSTDSRLVAVRQPATLVLARQSGASDFVLRSWHDNWWSAPVIPWPDAGKADGVLLLRDSDDDNDCAARLVVALVALPRRCPGQTVITRRDLWRNGAAAAWLTPAGIRVVTDRAARGARPWVMLGTAPRALIPDLPMAKTETLPRDPD